MLMGSSQFMMHDTVDGLSPGSRRSTYVLLKKLKLESFASRLTRMSFHSSFSISLSMEESLSLRSSSLFLHLQHTPTNGLHLSSNPLSMTISTDSTTTTSITTTTSLRLFLSSNHPLIPPTPESLLIPVYSSESFFRPTTSIRSASSTKKLLDCTSRVPVSFMIGS